VIDFGESLHGATVIIEGTAHGSTTDINGLSILSVQMHSRFHTYALNGINMSRANDAEVFLGLPRTFSEGT